MSSRTESAGCSLGEEAARTCSSLIVAMFTLGFLCEAGLANIGRPPNPMSLASPICTAYGEAQEARPHQSSMQWGTAGTPWAAGARWPSRARPSGERAGCSGGFTYPTAPRRAVQQSPAVRGRIILHNCHARRRRRRRRRLLSGTASFHSGGRTAPARRSSEECAVNHIVIGNLPYVVLLGAN